MISIKYWGYGALFFAIASCTPEVDEDSETGSIMEYSFESDSTEAEVILPEGNLGNLNEQPEIVQDFFSIDQSIITNEFCFDRQLYLDELETPTDEWYSFIIDQEKEYFLIDNQECFTVVEFKRFLLNKKQYAYLLQTGKSFQNFQLLEKQNDAWVVSQKKVFEPEMTDFYDSLSVDETRILNEYGYYYIYLAQTHDTLQYIFSEWEMGLRMGEKQMDEFNRDADFWFAVLPKDDKFEGIKMEN